MSTRLKFPVNGMDHIWGKEMARIELVEYGDYQCINCGHIFPLIKEIQTELRKNLKFIFRNFPLTKIHKDAMNAALAAEAAAKQNKFWEMHDIMFANQENLGTKYLLIYAGKLELDIEQYKKDIKGKDLKEKIETDFESGLRSGVNRTPSFFINEEKYEGIDDELLVHLKTHFNIV